jgi:CheY-like chemotaxis protein
MHNHLIIKDIPIDFSRPIILVADDDKFFREPLVKTLKHFGYQVIEAKNGKELYKAAELLIINTKSNFVIIVDNQMPDDSGDIESQWCGIQTILDLCNNLRANLKNHVIFLSRWELEDLPKDLKDRIAIHGLNDHSNWFNLYTSFTFLKRHIEKMLFE